MNPHTHQDMESSASESRNGVFVSPQPDRRRFMSVGVNLNRVAAIFLRQIYLLTGNASRIFMLFYWPIVDILIWGFLTVYLSRVGGARLSFISVLLGTVIFSSFLGRIQFGVTVSHLEDVWSRNMINLFGSPLSIAEYIFGLTLTSIFNSGISLVFMGILAWLLYAYNIYQFGLILIPFIAVLFLFGLALGLLAIIVVIRFGPSAESLVWAIPAALGPFSGVFYPVASLPPAIQWVAKILPSSYVFEGMRSIVITGTFDTMNLVIALALGLIYVIAIYALLVYYFRMAFKKGLFTRFMTDDF